MFTAPSPVAPSQPDRQRWLSLFARVPGAVLRARYEAYAGRHPQPAWSRLRGPEPGMVMLRGRVGGDGDAFNLGEMTVTRCSIRLANGTVGHGYAPGIAEAEAEIAAVLDGLLQDPGLRADVEREVVSPLEAELALASEAAGRRAAATRVEFFTLVRGA
jgi:alpha-D-ribose 1-methylphosphonate 5-triphosphate synthase subunit PhnG